MKRSELYKIRSMIEKAAVSLDDDDAIVAPELFPEWGPNKQYTTGMRLRFKDKLYKVNQDHISQADWEPDKTPALYTEVAKPGEIPVWKKPTGAQDAYNKGDKVHYPGKNDPVYTSTIDSNVWAPDEYPQGWAKD